MKIPVSDIDFYSDEVIRDPYPVYAELRALAQRLLGGAVSANRQQVAQQYRKSLDLESSHQRGAAVFAKVCAKCHRVKNGARRCRSAPCSRSG